MTTPPEQVSYADGVSKRIHAVLVNPRETSNLQKLTVNSIFNLVSVILGGDAGNVQQVQIQFRKVTHSRLLHVQIKEHFGSWVTTVSCAQRNFRYPMNTRLVLQLSLCRLILR